MAYGRGEWYHRGKTQSKTGAQRAISGQKFRIGAGLLRQDTHESGSLKGIYSLGGFVAGFRASTNTPQRQLK